MEWINNLILAIEYIDQHICEKPDYLQISKIAQCSLSRLQIIFTYITDISLSEYIRRRRMALAACELIDCKIKIIDLAFKYGYESPEAFTRSYKMFHGISPSVTRKSGEYIDYPPISIQISITGGHFCMGTSSQITACKNMLLKYIDLPAVRFIGKDVLVKGKERAKKYGDAWTKSGEFMPILDAMENCSTIITEPCALMHHNNGAYNKSPMHYIIGKFFKADTPVPNGFDYWDMPPSKVGYALFSGEFTNMIDNAYQMTRDRILADGMRVPYPGGYFHAEVYVKDNVPQREAVSKMGYLFACCSEEERKTQCNQEPYPGETDI